MEQFYGIVAGVLMFAVASGVMSQYGMPFWPRIGVFLLCIAATAVMRR